MRPTAVALVVALGGCELAVKHPPATAALVGGSIAIATCEIGTDFGAHQACAVIALGTAAVLGLVTFTAMLVGGKGDTVLGSAEVVEDEREVPQDPSLDQDPSPEEKGDGPLFETDRPSKRGRSPFRTRTPGWSPFATVIPHVE